jgi:hypothetical protein
MIKVVYAGLVFLLSSALVFLTNNKAHHCPVEISGVVTTSGDLKSHDLIIVTPDHKKYRPRLTSEDMVLVLGQHVKICARPDGNDADGTQIIAIHEMSVQP